MQFPHGSTYVHMWLLVLGRHSLSSRSLCNQQHLAEASRWHRGVGTHGSSRCARCHARGRPKLQRQRACCYAHRARALGALRRVGSPSARARARTHRSCLAFERPRSPMRLRRHLWMTPRASAPRHGARHGQAAICYSSFAEARGEGYPMRLKCFTSCGHSDASRVSSSRISPSPSRWCESRRPPRSSVCTARPLPGCLSCRGTAGRSPSSRSHLRAVAA